VSRIAIIGSGIAGMSAAYFLRRRHAVTLFEREPRLGGHTHTVAVATPEGTVPVDTGFIVHNRRNYPNLTRLFAELGVATQESDMSFSVTSAPSGPEWSSRKPFALALRSANPFDGAWRGFLVEMGRFHRAAPRLLAETHADEMTLSDFVRRERFSARFLEQYLFPLASAVWSTTLTEVERFPAATLVRFFQNHGFLGFFTQSPWRAVSGGSSSYIAPLTAPYRERIVLSARIERVTRDADGVTVVSAGRPPERFDEVVFACHGDQVLPILADATDEERNVLSAFRTTENRTTLHTDTSLLPRRRRAWASWNYHRIAGERRRACVTYHMNRLQKLATRQNYCVSLNADGLLDDSRVLERMTYNHPRYTREAVAAQRRWDRISGAHRAHFCGAYWGYGFHEDGLNSALRVAERLGVCW
jgi:predicted NAD/FAD-binding protein